MRLIDKNSRTPLYLQLMDILMEEIDFSLNENDSFLLNVKFVINMMFPERQYARLSMKWNEMV